MKLLKFFNDYWHFSRRYAQFEKLFELSQAILSQEQILTDISNESIALLNTRRIDLQKRISELNLNSLSICADCKGKCCQGSIESYFTAIDFWLIKVASGKKLNYAISPYRPWYYYIIKRLKQISRLTRNKPDVSRDTSGCFYLGDCGCKLDHADRPIKCLVATCPELREALDNTTREKYVKLIDQIFIVSVNVFQILKKEAGLPKRHGRLSLILTP